jgi:hypothetical protein
VHVGLAVLAGAGAYLVVMELIGGFDFQSIAGERAQGPMAIWRAARRA